MDRNTCRVLDEAGQQVALRKESVDRNPRNGRYAQRADGSLSARRAWIEIVGSLDDILAGVVALRKESVDRNGQSIPNILTLTVVALRKESVDRNPVVPAELTTLVSRSPQGERG